MKYAFIRAHREEFGVRAMCRVLRVHFSGFYAWLKEPLSHRAQEDARQTELIRQAWAESGKVYGYRKLTDDLRDQGERISENRVARLASLAGIAAQVGRCDASTVRMISSFSEAGYLMRRPPHPRSCFF